MKEVQGLVYEFQINRPTMKEHNTPPRLAEWMKGETDELLAEMQWGDQEPTEEQINKVRLELADVIIFALNIGSALGIDIEEAVREKVAHNEERFPRDRFQTGDFMENYMQIKRERGERQ